MPRDHSDELGEGSRTVHGGEREGSYGQHGPDSHGARRRIRSRSRSPRRRPAAADFYRERTPERHDTETQTHHDRQRRHRHRSRDVTSRSPVPDEDRKRHHHHHHHHHHRRHRNKPAAASAARETPAELPSNARALSYKYDLDTFTPLFAYYLDVQKNMDFYELGSQQARGRWKSFVNKWNRGELAEGWYDPELFERITREAPPPSARESAAPRQDEERGGYGAGDEDREQERGRGQSTPSDGARAPLTEDHERRAVNTGNDNDDSDLDYGPPPPPGQPAGGARKGPGIPTLSDLALQREAAAEEREGQLGDLRQARRADRAAQRERLDELVPRAEPGTRERRLEKKALVNEKMRGFREGAGGADAAEEVGDADLMGGGDSVADLKRAKLAMQRKKTERELRREAEARAREEERLERLREWREREEEKLKGLKELARARFG